MKPSRGKKGFAVIFIIHPFIKKIWDNFNIEHVNPVLQKYDHPCVP